MLYLALGHCNRPFDAPPSGQLQTDKRGPWNLPVYKELIRRGIELGGAQGLIEVEDAGHAEDHSHGVVDRVQRHGGEVEVARQLREGGAPCAQSITVRVRP